MQGSPKHSKTIRSKKNDKVEVYEGFNTGFLYNPTFQFCVPFEPATGTRRRGRRGRHWRLGPSRCISRKVPAGFFNIDLYSSGWIYRLDSRHAPSGFRHHRHTNALRDRWVLTERTLGLSACISVTQPVLDVTLRILGVQGVLG